MEKMKKFLIRAGIHADYDDMSRLIRIPIKGEGSKGNVEILRKMDIILP